MYRIVDLVFVACAFASACGTFEKLSATRELLPVPHLPWLKTPSGSAAFDQYCVRRQAIEKTLAADMSPQDRMKALEPYIDVGRSKDEIDSLLGLDCNYSWNYGTPCGIYEYGRLGEPGLIINYDHNGKAMCIDYRPRDGWVVRLRSSK